MNDLMIDLETLGTNPDAPIISIGAVFFDIEKKVLGPTFYMALDVNEQIKRGRKVTGDTLKFWMGQSDAAKKVFHEQAKAVPQVLHTFSEWIKANNPKVYVWGNGSTFDISMLENIYLMYEDVTSFKLAAPWGYNKIMDLRTFKRFKAPDKKVIVPGTAHNALDDAIGQANFVMENS